MNTIEHTTPNRQVSADLAAKGGKRVKKHEPSLTVTGYIMRNNERIRRIDLPPEEQQRLAVAWTTNAMREAGYEPAVERKGVIQ